MQIFFFYFWPWGSLRGVIQALRSSLHRKLKFRHTDLLFRFQTFPCKIMAAAPASLFAFAVLRFWHVSAWFHPSSEVLLLLRLVSLLIGKYFIKKNKNGLSRAVQKKILSLNMASWTLGPFMVTLTSREELYQNRIFSCLLLGVNFPFHVSVTEMSTEYQRIVSSNLHT